MKKTLLTKLMETPGVYVCVQTPKNKCHFCGKEEELRPYGPNAELICFDCGMKDEKTTEKMFAKRFE